MSHLTSFKPTTIHQQFTVSFRYPIFFSHNIFSLHNPLVKEVLSLAPSQDTGKVVCIVDSGVVFHHRNLLDNIESYFQHHQDIIKRIHTPLVVQGGEVAKSSPENVTCIYKIIHACGIDRHSYLLAIGGGAVLDMVGYAAATAHRGLRLIRVPTTALAQNDAGVGVKNAINAFHKKNFLGTFAPPYAVINDLEFLRTLSERDWLSSIAEAIKVALIKDRSFFEYIETHAKQLVARDMSTMAQVIYRCAQLHLAHISAGGDPFETGSSRPLDFGHWAAHKLEQLANFRLRHGEAVAIGICLDSTYANCIGLLSKTDWSRILTLFRQLRLSIYAPELDNDWSETTTLENILDGLDEFREHLGGKLTIMLPTGIGQTTEVFSIDTAQMVASVRELRNQSR